MKKTLISVLAALLTVAGCTPNHSYVADSECGYLRIVNNGGRTLGIMDPESVGILEDDGYAFKDLDKDGELDPYEDWRLSSEERACDLAGKMSAEEIAGLMVYSRHQKILSAEPTQLQRDLVLNDYVRHILITTVESPRVAAEWNNAIQAICESSVHGIPANNSSDPRHGTVSDDEFNLGAGGKISVWPGLLGMASCFDPDVILRFGQVAATEYRALGMATALSPQVDLATDPRWRRCFATFGEGADLSVAYARNYCDGFQTSTGSDALEGAWGMNSVNAMVKHWPGGGTGEAGRDAHFSFGKYAVYPGGNFNEHLRPFTEGAFKLKQGTKMASAVMPYYTISYGIDTSGANVGNAYSRYIISDLLRGRYAYDGVICTDWGVALPYTNHDTNAGEPWGVEDLDDIEKYYRLIMNGIDQFGGVYGSENIVKGYALVAERHGKDAARERLEQSAVRLLRNIFRTGLFDNPYLDPSESEKTVGCEAFMKEGFDAQLRSVIMLKNHGGVLPVKERLKVYVPIRRLGNSVKYWTGQTLEDAHEEYGASLRMISRYYDVVESPDSADFALVFIHDPAGTRGFDAASWTGDDNGYLPISLQYGPYTATEAREQSIAAGDPIEDHLNRSYRGKTVTVSNSADADIVRETFEAMNGRPVIVAVQALRPFVPAEIEPYADALLVGFELQNQAFMEIIAGNAEPSALLPMQMPLDMNTVELQDEDRPFDMTCYTDADGHVYDYAYGMNWKGVIKDRRTRKYGRSTQPSRT